MAEEKQAVPGNAAAPPPKQAPEGEGSGATPSRAPSTRWLVMAAVTAVVYGATVFASSFFSEKVVIPRLSVWLLHQEMARLAAEASAQTLPPFGEVYVIEDLVVNPRGSGGSRYVCTSVGLQSTSADVMTELETRDAQIKDCLIAIFSSKTIEDLADVGSREAIRAEIKTRVETVLPEPGLDAVYFVNFVLQ